MRSFLKLLFSSTPEVARARTRAVALLLASTLMPNPTARSAEGPSESAFHLEHVVSGLTAPVDLQSARDGSHRLFVLEQTGTIRIVKKGKLLRRPFLDLTATIESGGEKGLLGLTFHPRYRDNGRFFVNFTRRIDGQLQTVVAEFRVSKDKFNRANPGSARTILLVNQPFDNHNGGQLAFGPDGYLYISLGDGGSGGDPNGYAQRLDSLLGKILRIDVDSTEPYVIPHDNPFVGVEGAKGEIWAYGLRNPWRFSFDTKTKRLFAADVGQGDWEEVDLITKGGNFGWNVVEGSHCYPPDLPCVQTGLIPPIAEYGHPEGESVTGGYVYRGKRIPALRRTYVFADFVHGQIWGLRKTSIGDWTRTLLLATDMLISAFGRDAAGEILVLDYGRGAVYRLAGD